MPAELKRGLERILAAREGLLALRAARSETLLRFRAYAQNKLGDFVSNVDPITGMRIIELSAEGSKTTGELGIVLACFEGTRLRIGVDPQAQLTAEASLPGVLPDFARVLDVVVSNDLSRAEFVYEPKGAPAGTRRFVELAEILERMIEHAAQSVEAILGAASGENIPAAATNPGVATLAPVANPPAVASIAPAAPPAPAAHAAPSPAVATVTELHPPKGPSKGPSLNFSVG
jgi:hypothetical protein